MVQSHAGVSPKNGQLHKIAMGGPCRTVGAREAGNHINNNKDLPVDEKAAARSLSLYFKPVELYDIIRSRSIERPVFLQRCLNYKIHALRQKRIKVRVQATGLLNTSSLCQWKNQMGRIDPSPSTGSTHQFLPMFIMVTNQPNPQQEVFALSKVIKMVRVPLLNPGALSAPVTFVLPELSKLFVHAKSGSFILFVAFVDPADLFDGATRHMRDLDDCSGPVLWGKLSMSSLCTQWLRHANGRSSVIGLNGASVNSVCKLEFAEGKLQHLDTALGQMVRMRPSKEHHVRSEMTMQLHMCAGEIGHTLSNGRSPNGTPHKRTSSLLSQAFRNFSGRVEFHYLYYFNRCEKIEVMEEFTCPFCLVRCYTFEGLQIHLNCSHDLFNFEYLSNADVPVVNVTCRTELLGPEGNIRELEPDLRTKNWIFRSRRPFLNIFSSISKANSAREEGVYLPGPVSEDHSDGVTSTEPAKTSDENTEKPQKLVKGEKRDVTSVYGITNGLSPPKRPRLEGQASAEEEDIPTGVCAAATAAPLDEIGVPLIPTATARSRVEKNRQVAAERAERTEAKNRLLLQKRMFFHSHTAQRMAPEELLADRDSEDELDEDLATLEDRRMLEDFVDVSMDEKEVMHLWNSFVRKQRVLADGHCQWACEAFAKLHAPKFSNKPSLRRCFMLFLVKLWNHHLVDGATIDECLTMVDCYALPTEHNVQLPNGDHANFS